MNLNEIDTTSRENIKKNGEVFTPFHIIDQMLNLIPDYVWADPDYTFLEPTSGNGQFLLKILEKRLKHGIDIETALKTMFGMEKNKELVIISHARIFEMIGEDNAKRFKSIVENNIILVDDSLKVMSNYKKKSKVAVIGNPPYQMQSTAQQNRKCEGGKSQAKPLYHLFIKSIIDNIAPDYFTMIVPSRWMVGGMGLEPFRQTMMNDKRMKKIVHFPGEKEIFPTVNIKGGVNYFLWEKDYSGECEFVTGNTTTKRFLNTHDIILQDNSAFSILDKVMKKTNNWMSDKCISRKPFGLATNFADFKETGVKCITIGRKEKFVDVNSFTDKHGIIGKWKVCTSKACSPQEDKDGYRKVIGVMFVLEPNVICTDTYLVVNTFDNKSEADVFMGYMNSKFFRFMLGLRVLTQNISKDKFSWVPDLGDYSTEWTDKELYNHFCLNKQEIAYIESKIKAL